MLLLLIKTNTCTRDYRFVRARADGINTILLTVRPETIIIRQINGPTRANNNKEN